MAQKFIALKSKNRAQWLDIRRKGIGGSDISAILGLNKYRTPFDVYQDKLGLAPEKEENEAMYFGTLLEDIVAKEFQERTGMRVQKVNSTICVGKDYWMRANIDRAIINPEIAGNVRIKEQEGTDRILTTDSILECKTAGAHSAHLWGPSQELEIVTGEVTSDHEIPIQYELQVQWYLAVTGCTRAYVAVLIGGQEFRCYEIDRNDDLIARMKLYALMFWFAHVLLQVPPKPLTSAELQASCPVGDGSMAEAENDVAVKIGEIRNLQGQIKELKAREDALAEEVKMVIGDRDGLTIGGEKAVTWKGQSRTSVDSKKLKSDFPEVYEKVVKTSSFRMFKVF